jgi:O-antigen/teichoic acid export membrane protein
LSVVSGSFIELWIGPRLVFVALPLVALMWVNLFNLLTGPGFLTFAGKGHLWPGVQSALVGLALNIGLSVLLIYRFGFAGAVIGISASLVLASVFFLYLFHRQTGYSARRLFREAYAKPLAVGSMLTLPGWVVFRTLTPSWASLLVTGVMFGGLYFGLLLASGFFDRYDWGKAEALLPVIRYARRFVPGA